MYGVHVHTLCIISFASCPHLPFLRTLSSTRQFFSFSSCFISDPSSLASLQSTSFCLFITSLLVFLDSLSNLFYLLAIYIVNGKPANLEHSYDRKISKCTERISKHVISAVEFFFFFIDNKQINPTSTSSFSM